ncbi:MAG: hypothetical protein LBE91_19990 [Tannerella sp.]|jgi:hypothetical protein|nr:hypothetical protein [Tannerella sp.]
MNSKQNAKLNMAQRVSETLKRYESVYAGIAPMTAAVAELNAGVANIRDTQKEQETAGVSASTLKKREAERKMIEPCVRIANALYVIGFTTGDKELITLQGTSENSFYNTTGNNALALARRISDLAQARISELQTYGVEDTEIAALGTAIEAFQTLIAKPMDAIGERKQKTSNLAQLFAGLDSALYDKLDRLMVLFKHSAPEFYGEYRTARNIIFPTEKSPSPTLPRDGDA